MTADERAAALERLRAQLDVIETPFTPSIRILCADLRHMLDAHDAAAPLLTAAEAWRDARDHEKRCLVAYVNSEEGGPKLIRKTRIAWDRARDASDHADTALLAALAVAREEAGE